MVFSRNVSAAVKDDILHVWRVTSAQHYEKYLGLPPIVGRSKTRAFSEIKHNVWHKLQSWKDQLLSQWGKEILIKVVALSIHTYLMSSFLLPGTLCKELESMITRFLWDRKKDERKIHTLRICMMPQSGVDV